jgi:hypothetical protein
MGVAILALMLTGCASTTQALSQGHAASGQGAKTFGTGRYPYRFILLDPQTNSPWPNHPFRLFAKHHALPSRQPSAAVYHGVTDANGMTPVFRLNNIIPDKGWDLTELVGDGSFGKSFNLKTPGRHSSPVAGYAYAMVICSQPPVVHFGVSDTNGNTAYLASNEVGEIILLTGGEVTDKEGAAREACDGD